MNNEPSTTIGELTFGVASREGQRPNQEDRWEARAFETADGQTAVLALVADGIGGGEAGEMASFLAKEIVRDYVLARKPITSLIPATLVRAFEEANQRIYAKAEKDPGLAGMGTTCTAVVIVGYRLYLAHVGDTRAYLVRGNKITQLSVDHSFAEELRRLGRPEEEIRQHPNRHVIKRYLGIDPEMKVDTHYRSPDGGALMDSAERPLFLQDGDTLLLCSDGLSDVLEDAQLLSVLRRRRAPQAAPALVEQALKAPLPAGSKAKDNVTALVFNLPGWRKGGLALSRVLPAVGAAALILAAVGFAAFLLARHTGDNGEPTPTITKAVVQVVETAIVTPSATKPATATPRPTGPAQTAPVVVPSVTLMATEPPTVTPVVFTPTLTPTMTPPTRTVPLTPPIHATPELLEPACEQWLDSNKTDVAVLKWNYGRLGKGEGFEVRIWPEGDKANIRKVSTSLLTYKWNIEGVRQESRKWYWQIAVVRGQPPGKTEVLGESKECWFGWGPCKRIVWTKCSRPVIDSVTGEKGTEEYDCLHEEDCP